MLDRTDFASWQQRIRLYCRGKENGVNILKSIDEGPFQMGTFWETLAEGTEGALHLGPERPRVYSDLSPEDKERYNADIRATNILLQGLPKDIYTLINHYTDAKDIWDNVKMLLEGSELTKEDRESQLYDDFEHFRQNKGETIHDYYVRFAKLINDMRNIKMTMSRMQLNSKFVNNMLPEWGRFVTTVKLNRGLRDSNYDQLYAYLKQHEAHANENKMMLDRFTQHTVDPLALMSNGQQNRGQGSNARGAGEAGYRGAQNIVVMLTPDKMLLMQAQENGVALDEEQLLFIAGGQDNAIDEDVDEQPNKVAIGYKNPLCLTRAKQVQPALYNGYEIIKNNHVLAIVHNTEDTLEIAEITRRKMNDKMKDPECVINKVKIAPPDYSKENYLATFTPQKQLTPEQIFWSQDLIKMKAEALKKRTTASRPIKALMVYLPNTLATLVPRVIPTKSQVKINVFTLIQFFLEFEKTYKKRITPTRLTKGERGFEQTKECYLKEVIPFFKTLKEHFEGIQKALTKEIKEMKDVFEELEAKVDQNVVDRKHDEIEQKNLLIAHDNLIADCLSKEVFYVATNSELNVSRFTEMHDAHTIIEARCLELEAELSNLCDKIQNDNHNELVKRFSNLEVNHLNLQLKYQNLKESFGNNPSTPARDTPDFDSAFVIGKMKASLQGKDNVINKLKTQISYLQETRSEADRTLDFRALDFQITQLTEKVIVLQEQNELFRAENAKIKQHYKELYDSIKITRAKHLEQTNALTTKNENLKAQMQTKMKSVTKDHVKPTVLAPGKYAIDVEPIPPRNRNNREVHLDYLRHLKESVETLREIVKEAKVERPLD
ncbi:hypothetical protein Tco_0765280, partial [Tanacetum coccineum]